MTYQPSVPHDATDHALVTDQQIREFQQLMLTECDLELSYPEAAARLHEILAMIVALLEELAHHEAESVEPQR